MRPSFRNTTPSWKPWVLVALLYALSVWINYDEVTAAKRETETARAKPERLVPLPSRDSRPMPEESYRGQAYYDNTGWHLEGE